MDKPVTLDFFAADLIASLAYFVRQWKAHSAETPENWPTEMLIGDWTEHFLTALSFKPEPEPKPEPTSEIQYGPGRTWMPK